MSPLIFLSLLLIASTASSIPPTLTSWKDALTTLETYKSEISSILQNSSLEVDINDLQKQLEELEAAKVQLEILIETPEVQEFIKREGYVPSAVIDEVSLVPRKKRLLQNGDGNMASVTAQSIASACFTGLMSAVPPDFCYKKGGDFGTLPQTCNASWTYAAGICVKCKEANHTFKAGFCWEPCPENYVDKVVCVNGFSVKPKKFYLPETALPTCNRTEYKVLALCYRDCLYGFMVNCGPMSCSMNKATCLSGLVNLALDVLVAYTQSVMFFCSLGLLTFNIGSYNLMRTALFNLSEKLGFDLINKNFFKLRDWINTYIGGNQLITFVSSKAAKAIGDNYNLTLVDKDTNFLCTAWGDVILQKMNSMDSANITMSDIDPINLKHTIAACKDVSFFKDDPNLDDTQNQNVRIACAKEALETVSVMDPTGMLSIASALAKPVCDF